MRKIGIMGGTFNPVHVGHLTLAEWAKEAAELDEVWFVPTGVSHLKAAGDVLPGKERFHMTELAIRDNNSFRCLDIEIKRQGYTYSYETLEQLKGIYPEDVFFFIIGADCMYTMENWKYADRIFKDCILLAAVRGDAQLSEMARKKRELEQRFQANIMLLPFISMSVSSTELRKRIRKGQSVRYLVPDSVLAYIKEKGFYRE